jgi:hypothetical protein
MWWYGKKLGWNEFIPEASCSSWREFKTSRQARRHFNTCPAGTLLVRRSKKQQTEWVKV